MGLSQSDLGCVVSNILSKPCSKDPVATEERTVTFIINDKTYTVNTKTVDGDIGPEYKLVDYIRTKAGLTGTKYMCREGGCGCCCVTVQVKDAAGQLVTKSINSCLTPILSCDGWEITTVEGLGNQKKGYDPIQQKLVKFGGTQCGYCSPGMVMNMHSLRESKQTFTTKDIENSFDGNICRCTGYRPILDAFKSFASDAPEELKRKCADIEDLCATCPSRKGNSVCNARPSNVKLISFKDGRVWVTATSLNDAFEALTRFKDAGLVVRVVAGNTGTGVFKKDTETAKAFLYVSTIPELQKVVVTNKTIELGGGNTLAKAITVLNKAGIQDGFQYAVGISKHWTRIANTSVRNVGTVAGNLMLKRLHKDFPSDVFITLEAVNAELSIASSATSFTRVTVQDFLNQNMDDKLIVSIHLKPLSSDYIFRSFKITRRYQNSHAYVNAAFCAQINKTSNYTIVGKPNIVYGNINNDFVHATATERFLTNKSLRDASTLNGAMQSLESEIKPDSRPPDGSQSYRKRLTQALLYKFILGVLGQGMTARVKSGAKNLKRNVTKGQQTYDTDKTTWPINEPILKLESFPQVSGEAEYINDINPKHGELFGAFVLSNQASADIVEIDASDAEKLRGVVKFIKASDIPGLNNYMIFAETAEEVFASNKVKHVGQPVGMIIAENRDLAFKATELVKVKYAHVTSGVLTLEDKLVEVDAESYTLSEDFKCSDDATQEAPDPPPTPSPTQKIIGEFQIGSQYHFQMETHITICVPKEDGIDVYCSTQYMDMVQSAISTCLDIPCNEINIMVRRLGGAYGCKITRATQVACACAIAAHVVNRPVRVALDLETNMKMIGKRAPFKMKYEVDVTDAGKIEGMKGKIICNTGMEGGEETAEVAQSYLQSLYDAKNWDITPNNLSTNTPSNTWCRGPGTTPGIALIENVMEHIAYVLKKDPIAVRMANMIQEGDSLYGTEDQTFTGDNLIPRMIDEVKVSGSMEERKRFIETFNQSNRWKKRGMALVPMRYPLDYFGTTKFPVYVAIYKNDGTVAVSTGGIECGQGLNTKVAQAVAFELGISVDKIKVKPSNNLIAPNADCTGGSISSELCVFGALMCSKILNERMKPIKDKAKGAPWEVLVKLCYKTGMSLSATYMPGPQDNLNTYNIWVVNLTEVEIDCLTGESKIVRIDIIEDAGKSLNPEIDIGQVEGALAMGIGYWTTEKLIYSSDPPGLLTYNTWQYKPPLPKDIAEDLRVTLLKNAPNNQGILRSKATGEPPLCSSVCVLFALKNAIAAARAEVLKSDPQWFRLDGPVTPEDILTKCLTAPAQFSL